MANNPYEKMFQYPIGEKIDFTNVIDNAFKRIGSVPPDQSYEELQKYLQGIFYPETIEKPTEKQKEINKKFREAMATFLSEELKQKITEFDFDWDKIKSVQKNGKVIPLTEYESFSHKNYIEVQTLEKRYEATKKALLNLNKESFLNNNDYDRVKSELENIIQSCNYLIKNGPRGVVHKSDEENPEQKIEIPTIVLNEDVDIFNMVAQIDSTYKALGYIYDMPIPNYLLGDIFEKSLELALASMDLEKLAESLTIESLTKKTAGATSTKRGELKLGMDGYEIVTQPKENAKNTFTYTVKSPTGKKTFKISGAFDSKQQKMDVELNFGAETGNEGLNNQNFRVSAKNWKILNERDFGKTDLLGAFLRNTTLYDTLTYGLQMGWISKKEQKAIPYEEQLHRFAQLNLILDIIMGYSQEAGYADTIIINERSTKKIYVYSIKKILELIQKETIDLSQYSSYNEQKVKEVLGDSGIDWEMALNIQEWESKLLAALKSMKFNVNAKILGEIS